jgi:hypothetical protein
MAAGIWVLGSSPAVSGLEISRAQALHLRHLLAISIIWALLLVEPSGCALPRLVTCWLN